MPGVPQETLGNVFAMLLGSLDENVDKGLYPFVRHCCSKSQTAISLSPDMDNE